MFGDWLREGPCLGGEVSEVFVPSVDPCNEDSLLATKVDFVSVAPCASPTIVIIKAFCHCSFVESHQRHNVSS